MSSRYMKERIKALELDKAVLENNLKLAAKRHKEVVRIVKELDQDLVLKWKEIDVLKMKADTYRSDLSVCRKELNCDREVGLICPAHPSFPKKKDEEEGYPLP